MASKCGSCGKFTSATDGTKCRKCLIVFHRGCLVNTSPNASAPKWMCKGCKSSANTDASVDADSLGSVEAMMKAIELLRTELLACTKEMSSFRQELGVIRTTLADFSNRMDSFDERLSKLEKRENPVESIDETLSQLRSDLNDRDQELLLNDVEITGISERDGENLSHVVALISNKLGVNIDEREVVSVQRAGPVRARAQTTSERPPARAICVRLARRSLRDELLRAARVRRGADTAGFDIDAQPRRFYVNERLTRVNRQLFYAVRAKAKEVGWRYVWTREGRIFARRDASAHNHKYRIRSMSDIDKVFCI